MAEINGVGVESAQTLQNSGDAFADKPLCPLSWDLWAIRPASHPRTVPITPHQTDYHPTSLDLLELFSCFWCQKDIQAIPTGLSACCPFTPTNRIMMVSTTIPIKYNAMSFLIRWIEHFLISTVYKPTPQSPETDKSQSPAPSLPLTRFNPLDIKHTHI